jgi:autotransporter-associated beta strand protein
MTPQRNTPSILFRFIACSPFGRPNRIKFAALLALGLVVCLSPSARAATASWVGGASANWAGANWSGGAGVGGAPAPDVTGTDALLFGAAGASGTTLVDSLMTPSTYTVNGITFNSSAPGYLINSGTVGTNGFTLNGGITNSSGNLQTINDLITLSGVQTFTAGTGGLTFGGSVNGTGGVTTVAGGVVTFLGAQSYTGGVNVVANSTLVLGSTNGANTESGGLTLSGTLQLQANSSNGGNLMAGSDQVTWSAGGTLQLRGTNNASFAGSSGGTINTVNGNYNIDVNNLNGVGGNNTLTLNLYPGSTTKLGFVSYNSSNSNSVFNITGGNGDILDINGIGTGVASTITLNPTSASLILGEYYSNHTGASNLVMEGTATGNSVGFINAEYTGVTVTKENTSTWTINGAAGTGGNITSTTIDNGGGILAINNATALGTSPVTIETSGANSTGVLQVNVSGGTLAAPNAITIGAVTLYGQTGSLATSGTSDLENVTGFNSIASNITLSSAGGASSAYGIITSDAGNLNLSGNLTTSSVTAGEGTTFDFGGAGNGTVAGNIVDGSTIHVAVRKDGAGKWTLSGANTYSAGTTIDPNGGTLEAASAGSLPSYGTAGKVIVGGTSTLALNYGGASDWTSAQVTSLLAANGSNFANGSYLAFDTTNGTGAYSGNITGNMGLIKIGANMLTLSGTNTYAGTTTVNAGSGTLEVTSTAALPGYATAGEVTVGTASTLAVNYGGPSDWTNAQMITLLANANFASGSLLGFDTTNGSGTYANNISGSYGINKLGINTLTLTAANGYTGPTTVTSGTLALTGAGTLGAGSGALTMSGGTLDLGGASLTAGVVSITAAPAGSNTIQTGTLTGSSYAASNTTGNAIVTASLLGSGIALGKTGAGTLTLSGADTFTGATSISGGIVNYQNGTAFGTDSAITVASGATAQVQGGITGGNLTLTIAGAGATGATGALENVSGNNNSGGLVALTGAATISSDSGLLSLTNTGTIVGSGDALTLTGSGNGSISGIIGTVAGSLTKSGTGTWTLSGANTYTGGSTISAGTLALKATAAGGTYNISSGAILDFATGSALNAGATTTFTGAGTLEIQSGLIFGQNQTDTVNLSAGGLILVTGNDNATGSSSNKGIWNTNQGSLEVDAGSTLNFVEAGSAHAVSVDALNGGGTISAGYTGDPVTMTIGVASTSGSFSGVMQNGSAAMALTKNGTGTQILSGADIFTGATSISAGILDYENGTAFGTDSAITVTSGATAQVQGGIAGGSQTLTLTGVGATGATGALENVSGNNSYAGTITLAGPTTISSDAGTLTLNGALGGATENLTLAGSGAGRIAGIIGTTTGTVTKSGVGTWTLSGVNTYTGGTTVSGGTLIATGGSSLGTNGHLTVSNSSTFSYQPTAAGALALGTGVITLSNGDTIGTALGGTQSQSAITSSGAAVTAGTVTVNIYGIPGVAPFIGSNNLMTAGSGLTGATYNLGTVTVYNATNYTVGSLTSAAGTLSINVASATALLSEYWEGGQIAGAANVLTVSNGSTASNWSSTALSSPTATSLTPGSGATIYFTTGETNQSGIVLGAGMSVLGMQFSDTAGAGINSDGNTLTLGTGGITVNSGAGAVTLNPLITLGGVQTWTNNSSNTLTVGGNVSNGSSNLTIGGSGVTTISGSLGAGAGTLTVSGGNVTLTGANSYTGGTAVTSGTLTFAGSGTLTGTITDQAASTSATLDIQSGSFTLGTANFLVGTNTGTSTVNQSGGALLFNNASGNMVLIGNTGGGGTGTYNMSGGTITVAAATTSRGVMLGVNAGSAGNVVTANFNLSGTGSIIESSGDGMLAIGRYDNSASYTTDTFSQTGGTATINQLTLGGAANGSSNVNASLTLTGGTFSAITFPGLSAGASNVSIITIGSIAGVGAQVTLPAFPTSRGTSSTATITFDGGTLITGGASSTSYLQGFTNAYLTNNGANISVPTGISMTIAQALTDATAPGTHGTLTVSGAGTLTLSASNSYSGNTANNNIGSGGLTLANSYALGSGTLTNFENVSTDFETLTLTGGISVANPIVWNLSIGRNGVNSSSGSNTLSGPATILGVSSILIYENTAASGSVLTISGGISSTSYTSADLSFRGNAGNTIAITTNPILLPATGTVDINGAENVTISVAGSTWGYTDFVSTSTGNWILGVSNGLPTASVLEGAGSGHLDLAGYNQTLAGLSGATSVTDNGSSNSLLTVNVPAATNYTFAGALTNGTTGHTLALTLDGLGTQTLTGSNSYTGTTTVTSGMLALSGSGTLGAAGSAPLTMNGGTLDLGAGNQTVAAVSITAAPSSGNTIQNGTLTGASYAISNTTGNAIITANLAGSGITLTKSGAGALTLAGANSYTGQTVINGGTVDISTTVAVGAAQPLGENATVSLGAATLQYLGATGTLAQNVTLTGNGTISNGGGSTLTLSGTLTKLGDVLSLSGGAFNVTGPITGNSGSFNSDLDVVNGSSVTLSNANNNYYGPTVVSGSSTLQNGVTNALPATTILTMGVTGGLTSYTNTYDLNGYSQSIAGLTSSGSGSQVVTDSAASTASTLTITGTTSTETYGGVIQDGSGQVSLTVSGGSEVLNGANTYSGNTSVTGGTLTIGATGALTSSTNLSVANGGTFAVNSGGSILSTTALTANGNVNLNNASQTLASLNGASTGVMTLNSTSLTVNNGGTFAGVIQDGASAGSLTVAGGTMALTGDNTFSGGATVSGGTLLVSGSLSGAGAVNVAGGALGGSGYIAGATTGIVLTIGNNVALNDGSTLVINIDANTNATDLLQITNGGALTLAGNDTLTVDLVNGSSLANPLSGYEIASYTGMLSGVFANVNIPAGYVVDYGVTVANEITLQAQAIPEPGTWAMLLCGAGILLVRKRKRRQLN